MRKERTRTVSGKNNNRTPRIVQSNVQHDEMHILLHTSDIRTVPHTIINILRVAVFRQLSFQHPHGVSKSWNQKGFIYSGYPGTTQTGHQTQIRNIFSSNSRYPPNTKLEPNQMYHHPFHTTHGTIRITIPFFRQGTLARLDSSSIHTFW